MVTSRAPTGSTIGNTVGSLTISFGVVFVERQRKMVEGTAIVKAKVAIINFRDMIFPLVQLRMIKATIDECSAVFLYRQRGVGRISLFCNYNNYDLENIL